jgi:hypothetical protein
MLATKAKQSFIVLLERAANAQSELLDSWLELKMALQN